MLGGVTWEVDEFKEASKNGIDAYIWLYAGDHFLFSCATESEADFDSTSDIANFCALEELHVRYPVFYDINFIVKPAYCESSYYSSEDLDTLTDGMLDTDFFKINGQCAEQVEDENGNIITEKPIVHVLDSQSYFNITREATFKDIEFRGEQALVEATVTTYEDTYYNKIPVKKCSVDEV